MHGTYKQNTVSPSGNIEIIYGQTQEFGMGGPYASCIYLKLKEKAPFLIHTMCFGDLRFADDESCIYFLHLNLKRQIQVMQYLFVSNELKLFADEFAIAEFETTSTQYSYSVNGKNWIESENRYTERLIINDTNDENIQTKTIIEPKILINPNQGIDFISLYDNRNVIKERLKDGVSYPEGKIDYFSEYGYHIHYDDKDMVAFIEIMGDMQSKFDLYGKDPFSTLADEMIQLLNEKNNGEINVIEAPKSYIYLELNLGIFGNTTQEKYLKYIENTKAENPDDFKNGTPEWMLEGLAKANYFKTLGLGNKIYFRHPIFSVKE